MNGVLLIAGVSLVALGSLLAGARRGFSAGLLAQAAGAAAIACAGFWVLGSGDVLGEGFTSSFSPRLGVDGLSAFFLGTLGVVAAPAACVRSPAAKLVRRPTRSDPRATRLTPAISSTSFITFVSYTI